MLVFLMVRTPFGHGNDGNLPMKETNLVLEQMIIAHLPRIPMGWPFLVQQCNNEKAKSDFYKTDSGEEHHSDNEILR